MSHPEILKDQIWTDLNRIKKLVWCQLTSFYNSDQFQMLKSKKHFFLFASMLTLIRNFIIIWWHRIKNLRLESRVLKLIHLHYLLTLIYLSWSQSVLSINKFKILRQVVVAVKLVIHILLRCCLFFYQYLLKFIFFINEILPKCLWQ